MMKERLDLSTEQDLYRPLPIQWEWSCCILVGSDETRVSPLGGHADRFLQNFVLLHLEASGSLPVPPLQEICLGSSRTTHLHLLHDSATRPSTIKHPFSLVICTYLHQIEWKLWPGNPIKAELNRPTQIPLPAKQNIAVRDNPNSEKGTQFSSKKQRETEQKQWVLQRNHHLKTNKECNFWWRKMGTDKVKSKTQDLIGGVDDLLPINSKKNFLFLFCSPPSLLSPFCSLTLPQEEDVFFPLVLSARSCFGIKIMTV